MGRKAKYKKKYAKELVEMAAQGWPIFKRAYHFGVTEKTYYNWVDTYVEFAEAHELGQAAKKTYWHDKLETDTDMNAAEKKLWATMHLDYSDKKEVKTTDTDIKSVTINIVEPPKRRAIEEKQHSNVIDVTEYQHITNKTPS